MTPQRRLNALVAILGEDFHARQPSAEVRMEQVEAPKQRIQDGTYKLAEVVLEVAGRIADQL